MREVRADDIKKTVAALCVDANYNLGEDVRKAISGARDSEESPVARSILDQLLENAGIARDEKVPMCQDTGVAVVFIDLGQEVKVVGGDLGEAINEGVREAYTKGFLRKSMVLPPVEGKNTGDNTPAVVHTRIVAGDRVDITVAPKGGGAENMSRVGMLKPADGMTGIRDFVVETVRSAGPNPCPPLVVGVGIGGTFEMVTLLAKRALLRPLADRSPDPDMASLEKEILERVNALGIGPAGLGGRTTALAVKVETFARHIASFPVAVNLNCHAARHSRRVI